MKSCLQEQSAHAGLEPVEELLPLPNSRQELEVFAQGVDAAQVDLQRACWRYFL